MSIKKNSLESQYDADICLLLEGTYPYIRGGVSSWVHQIISMFPELQFAIVFLGDKPESYAEMRYDLPDNVVSVDSYFMFEKRDNPYPWSRKGKAEHFSCSAELHDYFREPKEHDVADIMQRLCPHLGQKKGLPFSDFLYSKAAWRQLVKGYQRYSEERSFSDFFWTMRTIHSPVFFLAEIAPSLPKARAYHAVSTGYAGLLGSFLYYRWRRPFILTEHGIYTKERIIDLSQQDWGKSSEGSLFDDMGDHPGSMQQLWIRFFEGVAALAYDSATEILAITNGNRLRQINDGADADRVVVVPNGVNIERFRPLREKRSATIPKVIGFVGRIVSIKDVKTLLSAVYTVCRQLPETELWMIGDEEEEPQYAQECHDLVDSLGLDKQVKFLGFCRVDDVFPKLGIMALSSISEGLPLVILESFASGVPVVGTDVGACRELVEGGSEEDRAIGSAGGIANIADPEALAHEILLLLQDETRWYQAQRAAIERVERYYSEDDLLASYQKIYSRAVNYVAD